MRSLLCDAALPCPSPLSLRSLLCDAALPWQLGFQDSASPVHEGIVFLHDTIMWYLIVLGTLVVWGLVSIVTSYGPTNLRYARLAHGTAVELLWTISPALVLVAIALPSFRLLYLVDEVLMPDVTLKVVGAQWYWTYEYSDYSDGEGEVVAYDSYMVPESDLMMGDLRLLEVDEPVVLPVGANVRLLITARDVMHDWAVPSLGLKVDAIPGRLNQASLFIERTGSFYGQCSELCGVNHGFMPIRVDSVDTPSYLRWLSTKL